MNSFFYKDYLVEILNNDFNFVITKDGKEIFSAEQTFPSILEAEVHAKLVINRLCENKSGWTVS